MSSRPIRAIACATRERTPATVPRSACIATARTPDVCALATASWAPRGSLLELITTSAPSRAKRSAMARPIPLLLPVTSATLFVNRICQSPRNGIQVRRVASRESPKMASAIDPDGLSRYEVGVDERHHGLDNFPLAAPPADRRCCGHFPALFLGHVRRREDWSGCDGVDEHT